MYCQKCNKWSGYYPLCKKCYDNDAFWDKLLESSEDETCEICGKESNGYPLCRICYYKVKEYAEEHNDELIDDFVIDDIFEEYETYSPGICITCGQSKQNPDHFLCPNCYRKYRNKELIISLMNAKEVKVLESRYYSKFKCEDGHMVKSKVEREIDNFLNKYHIRHYYEPELSIDNNPKHSIHPDFYLPDKKIYIEYWGMLSDLSYEEQMKHKLEIYKKLGVTIICLYEDDTEDIEGTLKRKLKFYSPGTINYQK